jgi:spore germination protein GerM
VRPAPGRRAALGATVALAVALCACGVPTSGAPRAISKNQVPTPPAAVATTTTPPADDIAVTIVLLDSTTNDYRPVSRYAPQELDRLATVLSDLLVGPQPGEVLHGLTTAIPPTTKLIGVSPNPAGTPGVVPSAPVTVNLSADFLEINGLSQVLAVEQVVFTVDCDLSSTTRVAFEVAGSTTPVPIANGTSVIRPVTSADYLPTGGTLDCTS